MLLALAFYGTVMLTAAWLCWHDEDLRWVAGALALSFTASNLAWFFGAVEGRAGLYTMLEMIVAISAYLAWGHHHRRLLIGIVCLALISICANVAFASILVPTKRQMWLHELACNVCFFGECLLAGWLGARDAYRVGRFRRRPVRGGGATALDAASKDERQ